MTALDEGGWDPDSVPPATDDDFLAQFDPEWDHLEGKFHPTEEAAPEPRAIHRAAAEAEAGG